MFLMTVLFLAIGIMGIVFINKDKFEEEEIVQSNDRKTSVAQIMVNTEYINIRESKSVDSATDFAAAVIRLEADKKLQVRLATQALKRLRELYNPQEMLERRLAVYDEILQNNTN